MVDLFNKFAVKAKDSSKKTAQAIAKKAREETSEMGKQIVYQVTGETNQTKKPEQISPIVEAMQQGVNQVSDSEHAGIHSNEKSRLDYLQRELEELKRKRLYEAQQKAAMEVQQRREADAQRSLPPLVEPVSKPKRGMMNPSKKKQGTKEMMKTPSG